MQKIQNIKKFTGSYSVISAQTTEATTPTTLTFKDCRIDPNGERLVLENLNDAQTADLIQTLFTAYNDSLASRNLPLFVITPTVVP
jgi:hypothetical protein